MGLWTDLDPTAGGAVHYDFAGGEHLFTWNAVPNRAQAGTNTFQIAIDAAGNIEIRFDVVNLTVGAPWPSLLGYTPGNNALDPGRRDISASTPFSTSAMESNPLTLNAGSNPVIGSTVNLTTSSESANPGVGLFILSTNPLVGGPFNLSVIGAPGCFANVATLDSTSVIGNFGPFSMVAAFSVPNNMAFIGIQLGAQAIFLNPALNAFGLQSSNGVRLSLGAF